ncbi:MAG: hypothetical protein IIB90_17415, partial [Gemmatimonadetes bacterium]|nr:hypothetical protein [Gemmatimonadota bacterium]
MSARLECLQGDIAKIGTQHLAGMTKRESPDVVFLSPPCKGFSGLLSEKKSRTHKYRALNELVLQGLFLTLETFRKSPPTLVLVENVPR